MFHKGSIAENVQNVILSLKLPVTVETIKPSKYYGGNVLDARIEYYEDGILIAKSD